MPLDEPLPGLLHGRLVEVAEAAAEGHQILVGQLLIPEEQHLIVEPRPMDRREGFGVERAQIDALHRRPEDGVRGSHVHGTHGRIISSGTDIVFSPRCSADLQSAVPITQKTMS